MDAHFPKRPFLLNHGQSIPVCSGISLSLSPTFALLVLLGRKRPKDESLLFRGFGHVRNGIVEPCARHDSNVRPLPPQGGALCPELRARERRSLPASATPQPASCHSAGVGICGRCVSTIAATARSAQTM